MAQIADYDRIRKIRIKTQEELDSVPVSFAGHIYIANEDYWHPIRVARSYKMSVEVLGGSSVVAEGNSRIVARANSSIVAWENSSIIARDNSSVVAWGNSNVIAWESSSIIAREKCNVVAEGYSVVVAGDNSGIVAGGNCSVEAWGNSTIEARENSTVMAWENSIIDAWDGSVVVARENSIVVARENSGIEAWGNSSVVAREDSHVVARENSRVEAWENSNVEAWENSSIVAFGNSHIEAWGRNRVVAYENSSVETWGNAKNNDSKGAEVKICGNARIIYRPTTIMQFIDFYGIRHTKTKAVFYMAVHLKNGKYVSDHDNSVEYTIGAQKPAECDCNTPQDDRHRISISHLHWALHFGGDWQDIAILEVETDISNIEMPKHTDGKVWSSEIKVLREFPLEECGFYGKILSQRRKRYMQTME